MKQKKRLKKTELKVVMKKNQPLTILKKVTNFIQSLGGRMKLELMALSISVFGLFLIGKALFDESKLNHGKRMNSMLERVNGLSSESHSVLIKKKRDKYIANYR